MKVGVYMFKYRIFTSAETFQGFSNEKIPKTFVCSFEKPIHELLDDSKSYIVLPDGYTVMKHSIAYIQDITNGE